MKLNEFLSICRDSNLLLDFLCDHKVLPSVRKCPNCDNNMTLVREQLVFRCQRVYYVQYKKRKRIKKQCTMKISIFKDTWFENIHLPLQKSCQFIAYHLMLRPPRQEFLQSELDITAHTAVDWASFCREVCILWIEKNSEQLGGENVIVEIDEAKIGKRKFNKGRLITGQWIFSGIERSSGRLFIEPVPDRSSMTLLEVIRKWIKPGTTIMSDSWRAYNCLNDCGFKHLQVNHKMNFVDPDSGAHTQTIERAWRETRANIPRYGTRQKHYEGYLAEFLFRRKYNFDTRITAFFDAMAEIFQIPNDSVE